MLPATLREDFGVSLWGAGGSTCWGELVALTRCALSDPSTRLGAVAAGWQYRASMVGLLQVALLADKDTRERVLPFTPGEASRAEMDAVQAEFDEGFIFSD